MAAGSALATCPPAHARDDDNTKARGPMPTTASTALAWGGYLWRCSHCSGPLVGIVPPQCPAHGARSCHQVSVPQVPGC